MQDLIEQLLKKKYGEKIKPVGNSMQKAIADRIYSMSKEELISKLKKHVEKFENAEIIPLRDALELSQTSFETMAIANPFRAVVNLAFSDMLEKGMIVLINIDGRLKIFRTLTLFDEELDKEAEKILRETYDIPDEIPTDVISSIFEIPAPGLRPSPQIMKKQDILDVVFGPRAFDKAVLEMIISVSESEMPDTYPCVHVFTRIKEAEPKISEFIYKQKHIHEKHNVNEKFFEGDIDESKAFVFTSLTAPLGFIYIDKPNDMYVLCFFSQDKERLNKIKETLSADVPIVKSPTDIPYYYLGGKYAILIKSKNLVKGFIDKHLSMSEEQDVNYIY